MATSSDSSSKALARKAARFDAPALFAILAVVLLSGAVVFLIASMSDAGVAVLLVLAGALAAGASLLLHVRRGRQMMRVLEQLSDAVAIMRPRSDDGFDIVFTNDLAAKLCGPALLRRADVLEGLRAAASGKADLQHEISLEREGGATVWLHCQFLPVQGAVALVMRDVSLRKAEDRETRENRAFLQSLIEYLPMLLFAKSFRPENYDKMVVWNKTAEHVMGYTADEVIGKNNHDIFPSKVADTLNALDRQMLASPKVVTIPEFPYRRPDGALSYLRSTSVPLFSEDGKVEYILGIVEDITARRAQEWELRSQRAELAAINDALPVGLFRTDVEGKVVYVNSTLTRMMGREHEEFAREGWFAAVHPEDRSLVFQEWTRAMQSELPYENTLRFATGGGKGLWATVKAAPIRMDGKLRGYVGSVDDITMRLQAEHDVLKGERWLRAIADNLPALIAYVDRDQVFRFTNLNYEHWFQREGSQVLGSHVAEVFGADYYAFTSNKIAAALRGERVGFERDGVDRAGHKRCWRVEYIPDVQDGKVAGFYSMVLDITEAKELENRLRTMARTDSLTGLANRASFNEKLEEAIAECDGKGLRLAVLYLDVDHFKSFNDNFGHHGGDLVLREFSRRLTACVRQTDTIARLAGDEFVILLTGNDIAAESEIVAKKIKAEMQREFQLVSGPCQVTASIGIAIRRDGESDAELLLRRADEALYRAKSQGRNSYVSVL